MGLRPNSLFSTMAMLHIKLKVMSHAATWWQIFSHILPSQTIEVGSKGENKLFAEHGHFVFLIKGITNATTCKHIICPYIHPRPPRWGEKVKTFFLKVVILHIKLKGMELRASCNHILCPHTKPQHMGQVKRKKITTICETKWFEE